jgi:hypothetical protein
MSGLAEVLSGDIGHLLLPQGPWGWQDDLTPFIGKRVVMSDHPALPVADLVPPR